MRSFSLLLAGLAVTSLWALGGCGKSEPQPEKEASVKPEPKLTTAQAVLDKMAESYKKATSYSDFGIVQLKAETAKGPVDLKAEFAVKFERPDKLHVETNEGVLITDGKRWNAWIRGLKGQVVVRDAPVKLNLDTIFADSVLYQAMTQGFTGQIPQLTLMSPQLVLLFAGDGLKQMLEGSEEVSLIEPGQVGDNACYRVQAKWAYGNAVFWIDEKTFVLRRMSFPTGSLWQLLGGEGQVQSLSLNADFTGAQFNGPIDPKAFQFEVPADSEQVKLFRPPEMFQLLGKKSPDFKLTDLAAKPVTPESLSGKTVVLAFWSAGFTPSQTFLAELEKVYQKFKGNDKVAIYAVNMEPAEVDNKTLGDALKQWKSTVPMLRDSEQQAGQALRSPGPSSIFLLDSKGAVQYCTMIGDDNLPAVAALSDRIEKLLAGKDIAKESITRYEEQIKVAERGVDNLFQGKSPDEVKTAERTEPKKLKLTRLWKSNEVKSPGNILVAPGADGATRLFVVDQWQTVAEVGLDGKVIATHKPELQAKELICNLRTAVGKDGKRMFVGFAPSCQRMFWFDENWKPVLVFPENALKNPHTGIIDVELGDLSGDGVLKAYVGYYGAAGVQEVARDGNRLWTNRLLSSVARTAFTTPGADGRRELVCASESGKLAILDNKGVERGSVSVNGQMIGWITNADLKNDGHPLWCGLSVTPEGRTIILGLDLKGQRLWDYLMPKGNPRQPIEPIIPGKVRTGGPGQWILPGCDGSIHILTAEGEPLDEFNYGAALCGLATVEIEGKPVLIIASENGLEALRVE